MLTAAKSLVLKGLIQSMEVAVARIRAVAAAGQRHSQRSLALEGPLVSRAVPEGLKLPTTNAAEVAERIGALGRKSMDLLERKIGFQVRVENGL